MIDAQDVHYTYLTCILQNATSPQIILDKLLGEETIVFDYNQIQEHRDQIEGWLLQFDSIFYPGTGGGSSIINMNTDKTGVQWTDQISIVKELVYLGLAIGLITLPFEDRNIWKTLPGGLPHITIQKTQNLTK